MAPDDKPYHVYRGGRSKGKVPAVPRATRSALGGDRTTRSATRSRRLRLRRPSRRAWKLIVPLVLLVVLVWLIAWSAAGFLAFRSGVEAAQHRLRPNARAQLDPGGGFLLSDSTTILMLGIDNSTSSTRSGDEHSDSIMVVRTDPSQHLLAYLSIPRDLLVDIPGVGEQKINAGYQFGGAALAIKTIKAFTGIAINHVMILNFDGFVSMIDAEGGVTIDVPENILSNRFDCPYATQARCLEWKGWRFHKGVQHMDGERALIYSRIRDNQLNPADNDLTREARQQAVVQAAASGLMSFSTFLSLPFDGSSLFSAVTTDLTPAQFLELGWVKFRSSGAHTLYCRLGGSPAEVDGESVLLPSEDNLQTLAMWDGKSAAEAPTSSYGPGCEIGHPISAGT